VYLEVCTLVECKILGGISKNGTLATFWHFVFQNLLRHFSLIPSRYPVGTYWVSPKKFKIMLGKYASCDRRGFRNLMFPLWFALFLCGSFVFVDMGPAILFLVFPPFLGALVYLWLAVFHQLSPRLKTGNESHHFVPYFLSGALDLGTNDLVK
jgi:hypothetical protein